MTDPTPQQMFEAVGRALTPGPNWPSALADLMGVRPDSVRGWRTGKMTLRPDHFEKLLEILAWRRAELDKTDAGLRQWLARQPKED
jgi:hypothetical protein